MSTDVRRHVVRCSGLRMRTVSEVTLSSTTVLTQEDHVAVARLRENAVTASCLKALTGKLSGQIEEVSSRTLHVWKLDYMQRLLRLLGLDGALLDSVEAFASLDVGFHNDAYASGSSVFCAAIVAGPARDVVFPDLGTRYTVEPGVMVVFDPALVHAMLPVGADSMSTVRPMRAQAEDLTLFLSAELALSPEVFKRFALKQVDEAENARAGFVRADMADICAETGVWKNVAMPVDSF